MENSSILPEPGARWLEISLTVDPELAEAVAEVLSRYVSGGVVIESGISFKGDEDEGRAGGPLRVYGYLPVDEGIEALRSRVETGLWALGMIQPLPQAAYRSIHDQDWMAAWKEHYRPIPIGKRLLILPAWLEQEAGDERIAVRIDPSMAFGTGTHPTTQLCLQALEQSALAGKAVMDIGCGSGILSIAAIKLGAAEVLAVDIDRAALISCNENAQANGVAEQLTCAVGSVEEILAGSFSLRSAPLVVANILAPVIIGLINQGLAELCEPGGELILSGILASQAADVIATAQAHSLEFSEQISIEDWVAIRMRRV